MRRFFSLFLSMFLMLTLSSNAYAQSGEVENASSANAIPLDDIVNDWIESNYQGNASVSRVVRLYSSYDNSEQCIGHLVSFESNKVPAGYIVLNRTEKGNPVVEFAFSGECVYDRIEGQLNDNVVYNTTTTCDSVEDETLSSYSIANENILYTDFVNYSIAVEKNDEIMLINQYNQIEELPEQLQNIGIDTLSDSMDPGYQAPTETGPYDSEIIPGALSKYGLVMGQFKNVVPDEGNCGPTSITNLVNLYAKVGLNGHSYMPDLLLNNDKDDTYDRLVYLSGYTASKAVGMDELQTGLEAYCKEMNVSCSVGKYWYNWWSDYTRDVGKDLPIWLYTCGYGKAGAHAQVVVGWRSYPSGGKYLLIYSGWTKEATYIKFKADCFKNFEGRVVAIS